MRTSGSERPPTHQDELRFSLVGQLFPFTFGRSGIVSILPYLRCLSNSRTQFEHLAESCPDRVILMGGGSIVGKFPDVDS